MSIFASASSPTTTRRGQITTSRVVLAAAGALVANLIVFAIATASDVSFDVDSPQPLNAIGIAVASVLPILLGALVVALVARRRPGFQHFAAWAGLIFALVTVAGSFVASGDLATALTLSAMHVVVGIAWFFAVRRRI
jgi:hypothetical protein